MHRHLITRLGALPFHQADCVRADVEPPEHVASTSFQWITTRTSWHPQHPWWTWWRKRWTYCYWWWSSWRLVFSSSTSELNQPIHKNKPKPNSQWPWKFLCLRLDVLFLFWWFLYGFYAEGHSVFAARSKNEIKRPKTKYIALLELEMLCEHFAKVFNFLIRRRTARRRGSFYTTPTALFSKTARCFNIAHRFSFHPWSTPSSCQPAHFVIRSTLEMRAGGGRRRGGRHCNGVRPVTTAPWECYSWTIDTNGRFDHRSYSTWCMLLPSSSFHWNLLHFENFANDISCSFEICF